MLFGEDGEVPDDMKRELQLIQSEYVVEDKKTFRCLSSLVPNKQESFQSLHSAISFLTVFQYLALENMTTSAYHKLNAIQLVVDQMDDFGKLGDYQPPQTERLPSKLMDSISIFALDEKHTNKFLSAVDSFVSSMVAEEQEQEHEEEESKDREEDEWKERPISPDQKTEILLHSPISPESPRSLVLSSPRSPRSFRQFFGSPKPKTWSSLITEQNQKMNKVPGMKMNAVMTVTHNDASKFDVAWGDNAFPDRQGLSFSLIRRPQRYHHSVVTQADGQRIFVAYLRMDCILKKGMRHRAGSFRDSPQFLSVYDDPEDDGGEAAASASMEHGREDDVTLYAPVVLMIASHFPQFQFFKPLLVHIFTMLSETDTFVYPISHSIHSVQSLARCLVYHLPAPNHQHQFQLTVNHHHHHPLAYTYSPFLSLVHSTFHLSDLFQVFHVDGVLALFYTLLCEGHIVLVSSSLTRLTSISQTLLQFIYPMRWDFTFIPTLSSDAHDAHELPSPYVIGMTSHDFHGIEKHLKGVLVAHIDHGTVAMVQGEMVPCVSKEGKRLKRNLDAALLRFTLQKFDGLGNEDQYQHAFDMEIHSHVVSFYSELLRGFKKYVFYIERVPFFCSDVFIRTRDKAVAAASPTTSFFTAFFNSRLLYQFLQDREDTSLFHQLIHNDGTDVHLLLKAMRAHRTPCIHTVCSEWKEEDGEEQKRQPPHPPLEEEGLFMFPPQHVSHLHAWAQNAIASLLFGVHQEIKSVVLTHKAMQRELLMVLENGRSAGVHLSFLSDVAFQNVTRLFVAILKENQACSRDVANSIRVLKLSESLFTIHESSGVSICMSEKIHSHPLFQSMLFWEEACEIHLHDHVRTWVEMNPDMSLFGHMVSEDTKRGENGMVVQWFIQSLNRLMSCGHKREWISQLWRQLTVKYHISSQGTKEMCTYMDKVMSKRERPRPDPAGKNMIKRK